jgi:hypothetical protein
MLLLLTDVLIAKAAFDYIYADHRATYADICKMQDAYASPVTVRITTLFPYLASIAKSSS